MKSVFVVACAKGSISEETKKELRELHDGKIVFLDYDKDLPVPEIFAHVIEEAK